jgi:hypothetical protein
MKRTGKDISDKLCDKANSLLVSDVEYETSDFINAVCDVRNITIKDILQWLFYDADWKGNDHMEALMVEKLNNFIKENPGYKTEIQPMEDFKTEENKNKVWEAYVIGVPYKKREEYKKALYNAFKS